MFSTFILLWSLRTDEVISKSDLNILGASTMEAGHKTPSLLSLVSLTLHLCLAPRTGKGRTDDTIETVMG